MRGIPICVGLCALVFAPALLQAADVSITVAGTASVTVAPDTARIHYGVKVSEPTTDGAKEILNKTLATINDNVAKLKIAGLTTVAAPVTFRHQSDANRQRFGGGGPQPMPPMTTIVGHASFAATITNSDPAKLKESVDAFLKTISEHGANASSEDRNDEIFYSGRDTPTGAKVVLSCKNDADARKKAYKQAVANALQNANSISEGLGGKTVDVVSVSDAELEPTNNNNIFGPFFDRATTPTTQGEVEVRVRVMVKCVVR